MDVCVCVCVIINVCTVWCFDVVVDGGRGFQQIMVQGAIEWVNQKINTKTSKNKKKEKKEKPNRPSLPSLINKNKTKNKQTSKLQKQHKTDLKRVFKVVVQAGCALVREPGRCSGPRRQARF